MQFIAASLGVQCDNARTVPCHDLPAGGLAFDTRGAADGPHQLLLAGADAAGNWSWTDRQLLVDNHAPDAPRSVTVDGGEGWHRTNGFGVTWRNPDQGRASPIAEARYRLCRAGNPADCFQGAQTGRGVSALHGLTLPDQGDWILRVWLADEAGNVDAARASDAVHLRLDPQVDGAAFEPPDRGDPRRLAVLVTDHVSGVGGGEIALRRQGVTGWRALPTRSEPPASSS